MARLERILASVVLGGAFLVSNPARAEESTQPVTQQAEETLEIPLFPWQISPPEKYGPPPEKPAQPEKVSREEYIRRAKSMITESSDFCPQIYEHYDHDYGGYYSHRDETKIDVIIDFGFNMLAKIGQNPAEHDVIDPLFQHLRNSYDQYKQAAYLALDRMPKEVVLKEVMGRAEMYEFRFVADMYERYKEPLPRDEVLRLCKEALDFGKPYEAHEGFNICFEGNIPPHVNIHLARAYLTSRYSLEYALDRYAAVVENGRRVPLDDIVKMYERVATDYGVKNAKDEFEKRHLQMPDDTTRGIINARKIATSAYYQHVPVESLLDGFFGDAPLDIGTLLELAEALGQSIDMKALRKDAFSKAESLHELQEIAKRTTPLTTAELEKYAKVQIMAYRDAKSFHEGVLALEELRKQDKHYALNQNLISLLEKAVDDDSLSSDDVAQGYRLRYSVDVAFPHHQFRMRAERQLEAEVPNWLDALRAARYSGDAEYFNTMLTDMFDLRYILSQGTRTKSMLARAAQMMLDSSIDGGDVDAAARIAELLYDQGFNEQARDCYRAVLGATDAAHPYHGAAEKRIQMCEDKMRKDGIPTDYENVWPKKQPKK